jgi:hypothetical protein
MAYKKHLYILLIIIAVLTLTYAASLVFDPQTRSARQASYVWLDSKAAEKINRITINTPDSVKELVKHGSQWFVETDNKTYPARQLRIDDFIVNFTKRASWPVRSSSASSHERLGLTEGAGTRVRLMSDNNIILDVLIGGTDITGNEIYLRKNGQNEIRSGTANIRSYVSGPVTGWYNLRLIPESEDSKFDNVQRVSVYGQEQIFFTRKNREWTIAGVTVQNPDQGAVDSYIRTILNTEGDDFNETIAVYDNMFNHSSIVLEFGNGNVKTIKISDADEQGRRFATNETEYVYSIPAWSAQRLFKSTADFEKE